ncbi:MAG: triose-phosphate isomerase [Candidatus Pacebacteria bacterium]|nr:triose-phosphate isomerase [Candidatus Paceibacterota bacterium]
MKNKTLIFNWKMNPLTAEEAVDLASASDYKNVVIAPPFIFLNEIGKLFKNAKLGAQDLYWEEKGAFTGEVSAKQLAEAGVSYAIIGHSERRHKMGETDGMTAKKVLAAIKNNLTAVLCIGETEQERAEGKTNQILERQLVNGLSLAKAEGILNDSNLLIAYEPVWAIGTGKAQTAEGAMETSAFIKSLLKKEIDMDIRVLYGGSVTSQNLGEFLGYNEISGALVGGASLKKDEVKKMAEIIEK